MLKRGDPPHFFERGSPELWRCEETPNGESPWVRVTDVRWAELLRDKHRAVSMLMDVWGRHDYFLRSWDARA